MHRSRVASRLCLASWTGQLAVIWFPCVEALPVVVIFVYVDKEVSINQKWTISTHPAGRRGFLLVAMGVK